MLNFSLLFLSPCVATKRNFWQVQAEIYDPSNNDSDKDSLILFQLPSIMEDFDTTALEEIINCLDIGLPPSESRCTGHLESVANAVKQETRVYALKFENMIFHSDKYQDDDFKGEALTPYVMPSSRDGEIFIHVTYQISVYGIDKLLKKGKKKIAMTPHKISKQMKE